MLDKLLHILDYTDHRIIGWSERTAWDEDAWDFCLSNKLIQEASPAQTVICDGCAEQCIMEFKVLPKKGSHDATAVVMCDKPEAMGLVYMPIEQLQQWHIGHEIVAQVIAKKLAIKTDLVHYQQDKQRWHIGIFKGKKHKRPLYLCIDDDALCLSLAGHVVPVIDMLAVNKSKLAIKEYRLTQKVDNPQGTDETPDERKKRIQCRYKEIQAARVRAPLQKLAEEEAVSLSRIKQILYRGKQKKEKQHDNGLPTSFSHLD
ncbi:MAG: hypothetical protein GY782_12355 [Gammaproteobacteria bacterium]|nr:hypothetical protein [Gammaproteobacteria bacterium]